jgi:hypothetical protein
MATVVNVYFARRWRYKMGEHTPGPWKLQECYDGKYEMTHPGEPCECDSYNGFTCKKHEWERKLRKAINKAKGGDE